MTLACLLSGCGGSTFVEDAAPLPPSLLAPCAAPVALAERALDDREIEILWGRDRSALRECAARHDALAVAVVR